jgi:pSer/pThr/pTyr-binding forkhead associated (FHA) protein
MDMPTIIVSTLAGVLTSGVTAYLTSRSKIAEERRKWEQDFKLKYADALNTNPESAKRLAQQYGIGYLINHSDEPGSRTFIVPNARITIGRSPSSDIFVSDPSVSMTCAMIEADSRNVYLVDLHTRNGIFLNSERVPSGDKVQLQPGDTISVGTTILIFRPYERITA